MRVRVSVAPDVVRLGRLVGMLSNASSCDRCDGDGYSMVVQLDGMGMVLDVYHPSLVTLLDEEVR